jgi:Zn-finger nucleic acid-binding protein
MQCPKCESAFETLTHERVQVDRCTGCGGIWLDAREKEQLVAARGGAEVDDGDPRVGRRYNDMTNISCPRCEVKMFRMSDSTQFHIEFESCPTCYGTFFDAGEFKDLAEFTIGERLRKIVDIWLGVR